VRWRKSMGIINGQKMDTYNNIYIFIII
jgi:hypothetical protein